MQPHKNRRHQEVSHVQEHQGHLLARKHVGEKADGEREGTRHMADQLDGNHERREYRHGSGEMREILPDSVRSNTNGVVIQESCRGAAERHRRKHGGRFESRYDSDQVGEQDKNEDGAEITEIAVPAVPHLLIRLPVQEFVDQLEGVLQPAGILRVEPRLQNRKQHDDETRHQ